jgi:copper(I)-binding protein
VAKELPGLSGAIRRFTAAAATVAAGALLVAGCSVGQDTQTVNQRPAIDGASADAGAISIRTAAVVSSDGDSSYTKGGSAQLQLVIINNGPQQIELQSVSSPVAASAQVSNTGAGSSSGSGSSGTSGSATDSGSVIESTSSSASASSSTNTSSSSSAASAGSSSATATGSPSSSAPAGASGSTTASASNSASAPASTPIAIPAGQSVQVGFGNDGPSITLSGLTSDLFPAQTVPITFTFADGSTVNLDIPVQLPTNPPSAPVISDATSAIEPNG